ncbi:MAG: 2-phospho-L-lactate guanylyltransferase [Gammaproteobacteria bacterium]
MSVWLICPVKAFDRGKSRLATILDAHQRFALNEWLLRNTLRVAGEFPGRERTLVVSACAGVLKLATRVGVRIFEESPEASMNAALTWAVTSLRKPGVARFAIVHADLPLIGAQDLRMLTSHRGATLAIAPDRWGRGTNALCWPAAVDMELSFGADSFASHQRSARRLGLAVEVIQRRGLAFDLDTPADYRDWLVERAQ